MGTPRKCTAQRARQLSRGLAPTVAGWAYTLMSTKHSRSHTASLAGSGPSQSALDRGSRTQPAPSPACPAGPSLSQHPGALATPSPPPHAAAATAAVL